MRVFWISWYIRSIDDPEVADSWPDGMKAWRSGSTFDEPPEDIWCARVEAEDEDAARERVLGLYGKFAEELSWRFCEEVPKDWWPNPGRFPQ